MADEWVQAVVVAAEVRDQELLAMQAMLHTLEPFDRETQRRMIQWVKERTKMYEVDTRTR